jgi:hypothetical protein
MEVPGLFMVTIQEYLQIVCDYHVLTAEEKTQISYTIPSFTRNA